MSGTFTYNSVDSKWNQFASKGDRVQFMAQSQMYQGTVESASLHAVIVTVDSNGSQVKLTHNNFQIIKRRLTMQHNIPIEVGDLVIFTADGNPYTGIITSIDAASNVAVVDVLSKTNVGKQQVVINKLSFLAKGYTVENMTSSPMVVPPMATISAVPSPAHIQPQPTTQGIPQINTAQNASQIALLYPAPCVVMAVPYNTNPDSFPEAMYVQMPDRDPNKPVLLPVVRMGCDTALVVIPPTKNRGAAVAVNPVQNTQNQARPMNGTI